MGVHHAFRLSGRAAGVVDADRIFFVHEQRRERVRGCQPRRTAS